MSSEHSVSDWLERLRAGDRAAAQKLWERYFHKLVSLARQRLSDTGPRGVDEEDIALSAFDSFYRAAEHGRFPQLHNRNDLWRLLVTITLRKVSCHLRGQGRRKRGGQQAAPVRLDPEGLDWNQLHSREPTPDLATQVTEEYRRLLEVLDDGRLRSIAVWKMEGHTSHEIAEKLGWVSRTVDRRLRLIRSIWKKEIMT